MGKYPWQNSLEPSWEYCRGTGRPCQWWTHKLCGPLHLQFQGRVGSQKLGYPSPVAYRISLRWILVLRLGTKTCCRCLKPLGDGSDIVTHVSAYFNIFWGVHCRKWWVAADSPKTSPGPCWSRNAATQLVTGWFLDRICRSWAPALENLWIGSLMESWTTMTTCTVSSFFFWDVWPKASPTGANIFGSSRCKWLVANMRTTWIVQRVELEGNYEVGSQESEDLLSLTVNCTSILLWCQRHLLSFADVIARHQIRTLRRLSNIFLSTFPMLVQLFDIDRLASTAWQQLRHCLMSYVWRYHYWHMRGWLATCICNHIITRYHHVCAPWRGSEA